MRRTAPLLVALTFLLPASVPAADLDDGTTLVGDFRSGFQDRPKRLEAVFKEVGSGLYEVDFYFKFNGQDHVYSGTAAGSLTEGSLSGEVENESKRRIFAFAGEFEKGVFRGKHAEITRGREEKTGTMTLR
jgi:hypothetical protein